MQNCRQIMTEDHIDSEGFRANVGIILANFRLLEMAAYEGAKTAANMEESEIHDGIEGSEFFVFDESGHFAPYEETQKFVDTMLAFYER